jgi:hypothetical protein
MDRKQLTRRLLLGPLDWITLAPLVGSLTVGLGLWALSIRSALAWFGCVAVALLSVGVYLQRLFMGWDRRTREIIDAWRRDEEARKNGELDVLYQGLKADGDPRTENLLHDLRTLTRAFAADADVSSDLTSLRAFDIVSDVDRLFQSSVNYLRQSLELWHTADRMTNKGVAARLLERREDLILEVQRSLEQLGDVLANMKQLSIESDKRSRLDDLRQQLNRHLSAAQKVEARVLSWGRSGVSAEDEERYLRESAGQ